MPDFVTHVVSAHLAARRWFPSPLAVVFIFGTFLPDLLTRGFYLIFPIYWWVLPLHTPVGLAVLCWTLAQLFTPGERRGVFLALLGGVTLHLLLDATQRNVSFTYFWVFPFSWWTTTGGIWWAEDSLKLLPFLVLLTLVLELGLYLRRLRARKRKKGNVV